MASKQDCSHQWEEVERKKGIRKYIAPGFFKGGCVEYMWRILQRCKKCGLESVVEL